MRRATQIAVALTASALLAVCGSGVLPVAHAECNEFEAIQSIVLSEATNQSLAAKIEVARVAHTHGACAWDGNFWSGQRIAERTPAEDCARNWHCRAYRMLYEIDPVVREDAAVAAYVALTEWPPVNRWHVVSRNSSHDWMFNVSACPNGLFEIDELIVC